MFRDSDVFARGQSSFYKGPISFNPSQSNQVDLSADIDIENREQHHEQPLDTIPADNLEAPSQEEIASENALGR